MPVHDPRETPPQPHRVAGVVIPVEQHRRRPGHPRPRRLEGRPQRPPGGVPEPPGPHRSAGSARIWAVCAARSGRTSSPCRPRAGSWMRASASASWRVHAGQVAGGEQAAPGEARHDHRRGAEERPRGIVPDPPWRRDIGALQQAERLPEPGVRAAPLAGLRRGGGGGRRRTTQRRRARGRAHVDGVHQVRGPAGGAGPAGAAGTAARVWYPSRRGRGAAGGPAGRHLPGPGEAPGGPRRPDARRLAGGGLRRGRAGRPPAARRPAVQRPLDAPGGGVEVPETLLKGATRECREETGYAFVATNPEPVRLGALFVRWDQTAPPTPGPRY